MMKNRLIFLTIITTGIFGPPAQCAIIPNPKLNDIGRGEEGFLELRPNGSLILRSTLEHSSNALQQAVLFKSILNAIRLVPSATGNTLNELSVKIYGDGVEHKFPPFLERVIQRIQTYFSVYKYTDTSEPLREKYKPTATVNDTLYEEIDVNLSSDNETNKNKTVKPSMTTTTVSRRTTTASPISISIPVPVPVPAQSSEENEFIETKKQKTKRKS